MTLFLEKIEDFEQANETVDRLLKIAPDNAGYQQIKVRILRRSMSK